MELTAHYDPLKEEPKIQEFWEKEKVYKFDPKSKKKIFSIDTPPPDTGGCADSMCSILLAQMTMALQQ